MKKTTAGLFGVLLIALTTLTSSAFAQASYPANPIRLVVGFSAGGTTDIFARLLAQKLSAQMNTNVVIENRPGAGGNIGGEYVANSKPDGYTLLYNTSGVILSPAFGEKVTYDVFKDLTPVAPMTAAPQVLLVHPSVPANTPAEFISHLRSNPDKLAYGSGGTGALSHLGPVLFLQINNLTALHVPYKGTGPSMVDLVAGRVQFGMQSMAAVLPIVKENRIKMLAIASLKRSQVMPDVPTLAETVMPGFEVSRWDGVMAPANTPPAIVKRLNVEIAKALQAPEMKARLAQESADPFIATSEEYGTYLKGEFERWVKVSKSTGIKLN